jgi:hypothetical protein
VLNKGFTPKEEGAFMNTFYAAILVLVTAACGNDSKNNNKTQTALSVTGKQFCRIVKGDGTLGTPIGEFNHCVSFTENEATDTASSFFGNPPETLQYRVQGDLVEFKRDDQWTTEYKIEKDTLKNDAGAILTKI